MGAGKSRGSLRKVLRRRRRRFASHAGDGSSPTKSHNCFCRTGGARPLRTTSRVFSRVCYAPRVRAPRCLITAGPTREPLDPVRFLSNRSSGRMGYALAEAALRAGGRVTLVSGPVAIPSPRGVRLLRVETAEQMRRAALREARRADLVIMAAAVADYRPATSSRQKIKKRTSRLVLRLEKTQDILVELGRRKRRGQTLVGFAAETRNLLRNAREKLTRKNLDFLVANLVGRPGSGFESSHNRATLLSRGGETRAFPRLRKKILARRLMRIFLDALPH
ncbi:MAG: phosphopantothenoylcysteine decarboxylase [Verrucomicrobiae bacterium]|nr:phosphopantothenoylcysteine decarboxylase [Verrucomicrobiae bacterium]